MSKHVGAIMENEVKSRVIKTEKIDWQRLSFIQDEEFKQWIEKGNEKLTQSILKYQFIDPFKVWEHDGKLYCLDGKHRWLDLVYLKSNGYNVPDLLPATFVECTDIKEAAELVLVYSSTYATITEDGLTKFVNNYNIELPELETLLALPNIDIANFSLDVPEMISKEIVAQSLQEKFLIPPFSIFDTRQGYWQDRKRQWSALGFNSQDTREGVELIAKSGQSPAVYELRNSMREKLKREPSWDEVLEAAKKKRLHIYEGASIFDPVLAEVCYRWFCPDGGSILDPFAGGSVRGIVAGVIGFDYIGIDLRADQVETNTNQWSVLNKTLCSGNAIGWLTGDSNKLLDEIQEQYDFVFSCPPYHDLEEYSDDPADLSNMTYDDFLNVYRSIIQKSVSKLKDNRFACFVVGEIRDEKGMYRDFVGDTVQAFRDAGMEYYNEIILINVAGSLPIRVGRQFESGRKVGKMHQNVLVFYKGDPKKIREEFPKIDIKELIAETESEP